MQTLARRCTAGLLVSSALSLSAHMLSAQSSRRDSLATRDSVRARRLDPVVVTAARVDAPLTTSASAVTRLSGEALRKLPVQSVSDALQYVPGIIVLQGDGLGLAPRLVTRGFYGGGETEYTTVLIDGVPTTELTTGQVNWDLVPLQAIQSIEIVRGGASPLYGDAAVGGVINLITRRDASFARWRLLGGEYGQAQGGGALAGMLGGHRASLFGDYRRTDGFRGHEQHAGTSVGGSIALTDGLTLSMLNHWRSFDESGPLADSALARSVRSTSPFYRFDNTDERMHRLSLDGNTRVNEHARFSGYVNGEVTRVGAIRTLPLSPAFADTKDRRLNTDRVVASFQGDFAGELATMQHRLVVGTDANAGRLTSQYLKIVTGGPSAYAASPGTDGALDSKGEGRRNSVATFAHWEGTIADVLRLSLGGRMDWIDDRYEPRTPSTGAETTVSRSAFSPRVGVNLRYLTTAEQTGTVYLTAGQSFKAPTMDQLFDQRRTPVPFPPFIISTSNPALEAQYGKSIEGGAYHHLKLADDLSAQLSVAAYQTDMRNELDFDLQKFKYVNIGSSRHRGVETGLTLTGPAALTAFANITLQKVTSRVAVDSGHELKAIPRRVISTGLGRSTPTGLAASFSVVNVGDSFLNDSNTLTLAGHTQLDTRASYPVAGVRLTVDIHNLFDARFNSTGFPDPAGSPLIYYYPAAGRVLTVGLESAW